MNVAGLQRIGSYAVLCVLGIVLYHGALKAGFYYDDRQAIVENPSIRSWSSAGEWVATGSAVSARDNTQSAGYRPVTLAGYALDNSVWGMRPFGFHASQLVLFLCAAWLAAAVASRLIGDPVAGFAAGLVVLFHPANVEAAVYLSARSSVLAGLFTLLAVYAWIRHLEASGCPRSWYMLVLGATGLALGAKESAVMIPLLLWVTADRGAAARPEWPRRRLRETLLLLLPVVGLVALYAVVRAVVAPPRGPGAVGMGEALGAFVGAAGGHLSLVVAPVGLSVDHGVPAVFTGAWVASLAALAGLGALVAAAWVRSPLAALFGAWIALALLPLLGLSLMTKIALFQEHRGFLAVAAFGGLAALVVRAVRARPDRWRRPVLAALMGLALVAGGLAVARVSVWGDEVTLWKDAVAKAPQSPIGHLNLGAAYERTGDAERAVGSYRRALALAPTHPLAYANLGRLFHARGEYSQARAALEAAVHLDPEDVRSAVTLALVLDASGDASAADALFRLAGDLVAAHPERVTAELDLAEALAQGPRWERAVSHYRAVLNRRPAVGRNLGAKARLGLGFTAERRGDLDAARAAYEDAIRLDHGLIDARYNLANVTLRAGRREDAVVLYERVVADDPSFFLARYNLGRLYEQAGRLGEAREQFAAFLAAVPAAPTYAEARAYAEHRSRSRP
jgi:tetratricopeptide (TPR) repeat protein